MIIPERARYTPSTKVATLGSKPILNTDVPRPLIAKDVPCEGGSTALISSDGTTLRRSKTSITTLVVICSPEIAETAIGTSCMDSSRFCAVTMTSSSCAANVEVLITAAATPVASNADDFFFIKAPTCCRIMLIESVHLQRASYYLSLLSNSKLVHTALRELSNP